MPLDITSSAVGAVQLFMQVVNLFLVNPMAREYFYLAIVQVVPILDAENCKVSNYHRL